MLVVGDPDPPKSLFQFAEDKSIAVNHVGALPDSELPQTGLAGIHQRRNAACAVAAVAELSERLPVSEATLKQALFGVVIPARFEELSMRGIPVLLDVAHNPAGAIALAAAWTIRFPSQQAQLIFACLADKDLHGIVSALAPITAHWHTVPLEGPRTLSSDELAGQIQEIVTMPVTAHASASSACAVALANAGENAQAILISGSFYTIADVRGELEAAVSP
jgi:dihydrofolate synthase/folylpolyglutamate synthase